MQEFEYKPSYPVNNIISNIVSKKQNLSYPLIFSKIAKYYWDENTVQNNYTGNSIGYFFGVICFQNNLFHKFKYWNKRLILSKACVEGRIDIVNYLLEGEKKEIIYNFDLHLQIACCMGHFDIVKYLVEKGANIHRLPLCSAASVNDNFQIAEYLRQKGAVYEF